MTATCWTRTQDNDGIVWLMLDRPGSSANALSKLVLEELDAMLCEIALTSPRGLVIGSSKTSGFIAGADIKEFTTLSSVDEARRLVRSGQSVFDRLEALKCPTVAMIEGFALGGGLELALACRHRVGLDDGRLTLGLPEVMLGIHPGFGGTVRAVRLLGAATALDLMLTGRNLRADKARKIGLLDGLARDVDSLRQLAREFIMRPRPAHRPALMQRALSWPMVRPFVKPRLIAQVQKKVRREHYPAPYALIDLWAKHGARGHAAYEAEADSIAQLFLTPTARNLVRVFLLQDALKAQGDKSLASPQRVHVIGAGVMGADIAALCATRGLEVTLQDRDADIVATAIRQQHAKMTERIKDTVRRDAAIARLRADADGSTLGEADVVIEAIVERADVKRSLFASIEPKLKVDAILATNTSSIKLEELSSALQNPERLVGLHFFNPVALMPLVEVVRGASTDETTLNRAINLARRIDKFPLPCRSSPGFLVNRVLVPYMFEAMYAAQEGLTQEIIDRAAIDFGMPVGPVELSDMVGLDVCLHVGSIVSEALGKATPDLTPLKALVAEGKLGKKSGEGLYRWVDDKPQRTPVEGATPADLQDRLTLILANECVACLREGLVEREEWIDAGMIFGAGYAPFRGGPLQAARDRGVDECVRRLQELAERYGSRFTPDPGWERLRQPH
ncbi:MAG: 3-hydroxyacyl-CoA dehydrogenase NAD-binding domain-containing protein [Steroidobacteraceae bacterium]